MHTPTSHVPGFSTRARSDAAHFTPRMARSGAAIVWLPLAMLALFAIAGLAADWGWVTVVQKQLQDTADAAALAAAAHVPGDTATAHQSAVDVALANRAAGAPVQLGGGDVAFGIFSNGNFVESDTSVNAVRVIARRTTASPNGAVPLFLARVLGINDVDVQRQAIAMSRGSATVVLLHPTKESLHFSGNGHTNIDGGVYVNSNNSKAISVSGNGDLQAHSFEVVGRTYESGSGQLIGAVFEGVDPIPDPLAHLPVPVLSAHPIRSNTKLSPGGGSHTLLPGRYRGGIDFGSNGSVTMEPGVYIIEGGGFKMSGDGTLTANGVVIYNTGTNDTTANADQFLLSGNGSVTWSPPTTGPYAGIALFYNRNLADKKVQISGNGRMMITGTLYAKSAEIQLSGDGDTLGAGIVASSMQISGNGAFNVTRQPWGPRRAMLVK